MKSKVVLSLIVVTYNAEKFLENLLESILTRMNKHVELVIIDGQSTDKTLEIISRYLNHISIFISEKDNGIYDAMNKGVKQSSGDFILFLGSDDKFLIHCNDLIPLLTKVNTIYYGDVTLFPSNTIYGGEFTLKKLLNKNICHQSILYPRTIFSVYRFNLKYKYMADYDLNLKLWFDKKYEFIYLNKIIARYNITGLSSTNTDYLFRKDSIKIIFNLFGLRGLLFKFFNLKKKFINNYD